MAHRSTQVWRRRNRRRLRRHHGTSNTRDFHRNVCAGQAFDELLSTLLTPRFPESGRSIVWNGFLKGQGVCPPKGGVIASASTNVGGWTGISDLAVMQG
ncbi:MAG: hypothetical protein ACYC1V_17225 [Pirellulaceae bacterium]